jgi:acyl carrier protein
MTSARGTGVRPDVAAIIADVFQFKAPLGMHMVREDIPRWDSLRHVALVVAIENAFGLSLSMDEMQEIVSIRDLHRVLERHGK